MLSVWEGPARVPYQCDQPPGIPFSLEELAQELQHIPAVKSVARPSLPGLCWKVRAQPTARFIYDLLMQWWNRTDFFIPHQWKQAWITFIHKPSKPPDRLTNLRPLALQDPIGKCVLGLLNKRLMSQLKPILSPWPQFAFCQHRAPLDAIRRVIGHCQQVRQLIGTARRTAHQRAMSPRAFTVCGGIQLIVDVHQAFDRVPRQPLFNFLTTLNIDPGLVALITEWHCHTEYILWHEQQAYAIPTGKGVRQGCRIAPTLWISYTVALLQEIAARTSTQWVRDHVTLFADDIHAGLAFFSSQQLLDSISGLGHLLDALEHLGLTISLEKTFVILHICGTNCRSIRKQIVKQDSQGMYIEVPRAQHLPSRLRVKTTAKYLGVQISYQNPETLTMQTRLKAAQLNFQRLKRWLCSRRIRLTCRLQMWHSCVFMSLVYGIFAVEFTLPNIMQAQKTIIGMYRRMLRDFGQRTKHTHEFVMQANNLTRPIDLFLATAYRLQCTLSQRLNQLSPNDILLQIDWSHLPFLIQLLHAIKSTSQVPLGQLLTTEAAGCKYNCSYCSLAFDSIPNLRRHETHVHGISQLRSLCTSISSHALQGLPTCSHCYESFSTWRQFQVHLERNCCQAIQPRRLPPQLIEQVHYQEMQEPLQVRHLSLLLSKPYGQQVLAIVARSAWQELLELPAATKDLSKYCILCGTFHNRPQDLNLHLKTQHCNWVPHVQVKAAQLCRAQASNSPCRFLS